jgi:hypothetical protein
VVVPPLVNELFAISANAPLFEYLRAGGDVGAIPTKLASAPAVGKGRKPKLLASIRKAVVPALQGDIDPLRKLAKTDDVSQRITILGEMMLAAFALAEGGQTSPALTDFVERTQRFAVNLHEELEAHPPCAANEPELYAHGLALREWAYLFCDYYKPKGTPIEVVQLLGVRMKVSHALSLLPHLISETTCTLGAGTEASGDVTMATKCYSAVHDDLRYLVTRYAEFPRTEAAFALYWFQYATEQLARLKPDNKGIKSDLLAVRKVRKKEGFPDAPALPRFGPIAQTYLDRVPYLALVVRDIQTNYDADQPDASAATICGRYGCSSDELRFYLSAIGSYHVRRAILAGTHTMYDDDHEEVFAALDYLEGASKPAKKGKG